MLHANIWNQQGGEVDLVLLKSDRNNSSSSTEVLRTLFFTFSNLDNHCWIVQLMVHHWQ